MSEAALDTFQVTRNAIDPRADGGRRLVHVGATRVTIERVLRGMRMKVGVPVAAYRSLVLAVRRPTGRATLTLHHDDGELDVMLASGDAIELARKARAWSHVLGRPVEIEDACIAISPPQPRRGKPMKPARRSRFSRRRKPGDTARLNVTFANEREIIARS